jgi:hypothetical protein
VVGSTVRFRHVALIFSAVAADKSKMNVIDFIMSVSAKGNGHSSLLRLKLTG